MLTELALTAMVAAATPTPEPGLAIKGVTVDRRMPGDVTHIEAPQFNAPQAKAYRIQAAPEASPSAAPTPAPARKRHP